MARYLEIVPVGEIIDEGLVKGRIRLRFNIRVEKTHSNTFLQELIKRLVDTGVGTSANIFESSRAEIPEGAGPFLTIRQSGGLEPNRIHNAVTGTVAYQRPSAQVTVIASSYPSANTMICAAYSALVGVRNVSLSA